MTIDATSAAAATSSASSAATDQTKLTGDLNRFLTLLVTQLQNQDPLEPLDANQFTSQLVQFASVEQQINQNSNLEKLLAAQSESALSAATGYLGATVEASGTALPLQNGSASASFTLSQAAKQAIAVVRDSSGKTVFSQAVETAAGSHAFHWDGRTTAGGKAGDGIYSLNIVAQSRSSGDALTVKQTWSGQVTGVGNGTSGVQLRIGDASVALANVISVGRPAGAAAD